MHFAKSLVSRNDSFLYLTLVSSFLGGKKRNFNDEIKIHAAYFSQSSISSVQYVSVQFSSFVQSCPTFCDPMNRSTPGLPAITNSQSSLKLMSIELVMPSNHFILCHPLLPLPSIFPSIRVFSNELALCIRWTKY